MITRAYAPLRTPAPPIAAPHHFAPARQPQAASPAFNTRLGHDFNQVQINRPAVKGAHREDDIAEGSGGSVTTAPLDAGTPTPAPAPAGGGSAAVKTPTLGLSGVDAYSGTAESHEKITYAVDVPSGTDAKDYCLVQWTKGFAKNGSGAFFKSTVYGKDKDWNDADWVIDSVDEDPIYWSDSTARWNYNLSGNKFTATDDPGPALTSEKGAVYAAQFKVAVYETAKVPTTTTGTIATTPLTAFQFWNYSVVVDKDGKFTHPKL
jgi:hypothetical protein